jgi:hypothetical protein
MADENKADVNYVNPPSLARLLTYGRCTRTAADLHGARGGERSGRRNRRKRY